MQHPRDCQPDVACGSQIHDGEPTRIKDLGNGRSSDAASNECRRSSIQGIRQKFHPFVTDKLVLKQLLLLQLGRSTEWVSRVSIVTYDPSPAQRIRFFLPPANGNAVTRNVRPATLIDPSKVRGFSLLLSCGVICTGSRFHRLPRARSHQLERIAGQCSG
jgi:hypothetical protein